EEDFADRSAWKDPFAGDGAKHIVFAGTFYEKAAHLLDSLVNAVLDVEAKHPEKKGAVKFVFIGYVPDGLLNHFARCPQSFVYLGKKSLQETYSYLAHADYCSLFLTDDLNYSFSTKFYEYIALGRRIMSFSRSRGYNARVIEENGLGVAV